MTHLPHPSANDATSPDYRSGACGICHALLPIQVCRSAAGYYIGTSCPTCGPHSRFSGYGKSRKEAEQVLTAFLADPCRLHPYFQVDTLCSVQWLACEQSSGEVLPRQYPQALGEG